MGNNNSKKSVSHKHNVHNQTNLSKENINNIPQGVNQKKEINIYYKGTQQKIKYYGDFDIEETKRLIKQLFKIKESTERFYFQDEDGSIFILSKNIPSGISVYLLVEPEPIPKNPEKALEIKNENSEGLLKFHWVGNEKCIIDKFIFQGIPYDECTTLKSQRVFSSACFEKGKYYFVIRINCHDPYSDLCLIPYEKKEGFSFPCYSSLGFSSYPGGCDKYFDENKEKENDILTIELVQDVGFYIDMDNKIFRLYNNDSHKLLEKEGKIKSDKIILTSWIKHGGKKGKTIVILNGGCIPIPEWIKKK